MRRRFDHVRAVLVHGRILAHRFFPDHDVDQVHRALEDGLLDVGHAVLRTQRLDQRLGLLVGPHRQVRPQMMLHLVIQKPVEEVRNIITAGEVGTANNLSKVEGRASGLAVLLEAVQVKARVIRRDDYKRVEVRAELGQRERDQASEVRRVRYK